MQLLRQTAALFFPMYSTLRKTRDAPLTYRIFQDNFLISERDYLEYLLELFLWFLRTPEVCGVGNKGINMMNYVGLSGTYQIWDVAYVLFDKIGISPSSPILATVWRLSWGFRPVGEVEGWWWAVERFWFFFVDCWIGYSLALSVTYHSLQSRPRKMIHQKWDRKSVV